MHESHGRLCFSAARRPRTRGLRFDVDPVEQIVESALIDREARLVASHLGNAEIALVQTLVELAESRAVEEQDFDRITTAFAKVNEERAATRGPSDALFGDPGESVEAPAKVDGLHPYEDLDASRDHPLPERFDHLAQKRVVESRRVPRRARP